MLFPSRRTARWLSVFIAAAILLLSLIPLPPPPLQLISYRDKIEHLLAYVVLSFFVAVATAPVPTDRRPQRPLRAILVVAGLCALYGIALELIQPSVGRQAELLDGIADLLGSLIGASLGRLPRRKPPIDNPPSG
jgi:VanZ family protein